MPEHQFAEILRELQETPSELQEPKNREVRLTLVRHMRLLLKLDGLRRKGVAGRRDEYLL
jgi:hypothetical protein